METVATQAVTDPALAMRAEARAAPVQRIVPARAWRSLGLRELWDSRELLYFLTWRDVRVRYKQTALGASWAVLQPLLSVGVFSVFFGTVAKLPSDGIPYPLFTFAALVPWTFFARGVGLSANSLVGNANLLTKVYFPRLAIPVASVLAAAVDFVVALAALFVFMALYRVAPRAGVVWLPALSAVALAAALGTGLLLSAINVRYRDVGHIVPFLTQIWMFATPVVYPSSLLAPRWRLPYAVNPMVGVVEGFRHALFGVGPNPVPMVIVSAASASMLLAAGMLLFRRMERTFADLV